MSKKNKKQNSHLRQFAVVAAAVIFVAAAFLLFMFRDEIGDLVDSKDSNEDIGEAWAFEAGASQVFAAAGNGLATASSTGLQLLGSDGYTVVRHICSLETPALAVSDKLAAAFDIGGTTLRVADFEGNVTEMDTDGVIISVTMNTGGYMAVTTTESGYKGIVTVYNDLLEPVYEWYSGEGYPLTARVSPDCKLMAALTADEDGGHVHVYTLSGDKETGAFVAAGELLVDLAWMDSGRLCAISEQRAIFLEDTGELVGEYGFGGMYLTDYSFGGTGFLTLALSKYLSANANSIVTVGDTGEQLGEFEPESELKYLTASGKQVLALFSDGLTLFSQSLNRNGSESDVQNIKKALLRPKGDVMMIFTAYAQIASP